MDKERIPSRADIIRRELKKWFRSDLSQKNFLLYRKPDLVKTNKGCWIGQAVCPRTMRLLYTSRVYGGIQDRDIILAGNLTVQSLKNKLKLI